MLKILFVHFYKKFALIDRNLRACRAKSLEIQQELEEAQNQIKFLEGQIKMMEEKIQDVKKQYQQREDRLFDTLNIKKGKNA